MIGYVVLGTNDLPRAKSFYDTLLAEMGVSCLMEFGGRGYGWAASMDQPMLCIMTPYDGNPATVGNGVMVALAVDSKEMVHKVYDKAIELGEQIVEEPWRATLSLWEWTKNDTEHDSRQKRPEHRLDYFAADSARIVRGAVEAVQGGRNGAAG